MAQGGEDFERETEGGVTCQDCITAREVLGEHAHCMECAIKHANQLTDYRELTAPYVCGHCEQRVQFLPHRCAGGKSKNYTI